MNSIFDDRLFLPVPTFSQSGFTLYERIVLANSLAKYPIDLWFLDRKTISKYQALVWDQPITHGWSLYMPTRDCPIDFRENAMWSILWSVAKGTKLRPGKGTQFKDWLAGFEKMIGLGQREAKTLCERLKDRGMIDVKFGSGFQHTCFKLNDPEPYRQWFASRESDNEFPAEWNQQTEQVEQEPETADTIPVTTLVNTGMTKKEAWALLPTDCTRHERISMYNVNDRDAEFMLKFLLAQREAIGLPTEAEWNMLCHSNPTDLPELHKRIIDERPKQ